MGPAVKRGRRLALAVALRLAGTPVSNDVHRVLSGGVCPRCGVWRCPDCQWLIVFPNDHEGMCPRRYLPHGRWP